MSIMNKNKSKLNESVDMIQLDYFDAFSSTVFTVLFACPLKSSASKISKLRGFTVRKLEGTDTVPVQGIIRLKCNMNL